MSLILTGNSSSLTVDSTNGITFPYGSNAQVAPSKVLQVVTNTSNTTVTTTSASFVTSGLTCSITPLFATSKILILVNAEGYMGSSTQSMAFTVYRGTTSGTNLGDGTWGFGGSFSASAAINASVGINYLDSPATTSSTTYTLALRSEAGGSASYCINGQKGVMTLLEIAA